MTTQTDTLTGCIERIAELLVGKGPEHDPLRRVVTCTDETAEWDWPGNGDKARCRRCFVERGVQEAWEHPASRAAFWVAAEERDLGAAGMAILMALPCGWSLTRTGPGYRIVIDGGESWADGAYEYGKAYDPLEPNLPPNVSLAVAQVVVAWLEAA